MAGWLYVPKQALTRPGGCVGLHVSWALWGAWQASAEHV